ncbi:MAG: hypothetical protein AAFZ63_18850 [Bacteroidota bacterium]
MQKHLYFICPTDHLEPVIDRAFKRVNYFYSSLGNSIMFDADTVGQISMLLETKEIDTISFILANDNRIIKDGLGQQEYVHIAGLNTLYKQIKSQKKDAEISWQTPDHQFLILSYHLNNKIKELKRGLQRQHIEQRPIQAKIYRRHQQQFNDIYLDMVCREHFALN